jgi:hypothetical protein
VGAKIGRWQGALISLAGLKVKNKEYFFAFGEFSGRLPNISRAQNERARAALLSYTLQCAVVHSLSAAQEIAGVTFSGGKYCISGNL